MNYFENLQLKWKLIIGFAIPLILFMVIAITVFLSLGSLLRTSGWVNHTYQAIDLGKSVTSSLVNMETGLRGFLVAGKEEFLEPYHIGKENFAKRANTIKQKVSDNPSQVKRIETVENLHAQWQTLHVEPAMAYRREVVEGAAAAAYFKEVSARIVGKEKFDGFRAALAKVKRALEKSGNTKGLTLTQQMLLDMVNQETGQRGFLLSGKEESLEPYNSGIVSFDKTAKSLRRVLRNSGISTRALDNAINLANEWQTQAAEPEIEARRDMNKVTRTIDDVTAFIEQGIGKKYMDEMRGVLDDFVAAEAALIVERNEDQQSTATWTKALTIVGALLALAIGSLVTFFLTRMVLKQLGGDPRELQNISERIAEGDFDMMLDTHNTTGVLQSMAIMRENLSSRRQGDIQIQNEIDMLVSAATAGDFTKQIDLQGKEGVFLDVSRGLNQLLKTCELGLNDVIRVLGAIAQGDLSQSIDAEYQGAFKELKNYSNNTVVKIKQVMDEIGTVVDAGNRGDFKTHIELTGKTGFFKDLSGSLNDLMHTTDKGLADVLRILEALAKGDLSQSIDTEYQGAFKQLKDYANNTVQQIKEVMDEIARLVDAANQGDFSSHIDVSLKTGFFESLSSSLNDLMATTDRGLNDVLRILTALAEGDLSERITHHYSGSFEQLKNDANATADKLTEVLQKIKQASDSIGASTSEISRGNLDLSARTEQQASALEETSSSMEEMTATIKQSAANANNANTLSINAQDKASEGGQIVHKAVEAMAKINKSSKEIGDIIGVIDEIAFQTNLLALNAAVEAARAGEQGRGFAVVAGEVRNLAQRSADAAKQIKDLIQDSVKKVEDGTVLVNQSGETLNEIVNAVKEVSTIIIEISDASKEQSVGIQQVNSAIMQMDSMTQQNAALAEQASAAGVSMNDEVQSMMSMVNFFSTESKTNNDDY